MPPGCPLFSRFLSLPHSLSQSPISLSSSLFYIPARPPWVRNTRPTIVKPPFPPSPPFIHTPPLTAFQPSCPANGWTSGVDALWNLPNGSPLGLQPRVSEPAPTPAPATVSAPAAGVAGGRRAAASCSLLPGVDFDHGSMGPLPSPAAASAAACCGLCTAHAGCVAAAFAGGRCYMKNATQAALAESGYSSAGSDGRPLARTILAQGGRGD